MTTACIEVRRAYPGTGHYFLGCGAFEWFHLASMVRVLFVVDDFGNLVGVPQ